MRICLMKIRERSLAMKLARVEQTLDGSRLIFYYTAEGRVDFRELVRDLAAHFRTRIEMRQIGVRDEAKMLGGYGSCGRPLCCTTWLQSFEPITIKMAKQQNLSLNPSKLSGMCGRLKCCLRYELPNGKGVKHGGCAEEGGCNNPTGCGTVPAAAADPAAAAPATDRDRAAKRGTEAPDRHHLRRSRRASVQRSRQSGRRSSRHRRLRADPVRALHPPAAASVRPGACRPPSPAAPHTTRSSRRPRTRCRGRSQAIATAPISKEAFALAGLPWRGHTELLQHLTGARARRDAVPRRRADGRRSPRFTCRSARCRAR